MVAPFRQYTEQVSHSHLYRLPWGSYIAVTDVDIWQQGIRQKGPFVDTAYKTVIKRGETPYVQNFPDSYVRRDEQAAINAARSKFVSMLGDSSSFGATGTAERQSTWGTVVSSITNALLAAKAVSRGQLGKAADILGFHPPTVTKVRKVGKRKRKTVRTENHWVMPDGRHVAQSAGNKWLWYSYGVKPLVSDIYNGMDILTREAPWKRVMATGFSSSKTGPTGSYQTVVSSKTSVRISADIRVANPNLWLANQLGLLNPVQWINEAIPFSFVIDWFSNLSQIIMQMTDFVGLEIARPITASKCYAHMTQVISDFEFGLASNSNMTVFERTLAIPTAKLRFAYERFQWQRGANAISLLVQFLPKKRG